MCACVSFFVDVALTSAQMSHADASHFQIIGTPWIELMGVN